MGNVCSHVVRAESQTVHRRVVCSGPIVALDTTNTMDFFHEYGGDPLKPSLFELVAQEQLRDLLQPALKYVLSVSPTTVVLQSAEL